MATRRTHAGHTQDTLAAAYAADGQSRKAQQMLQAAIKLASQEQQADYYDRLLQYSIRPSYIERLEDPQAQYISPSGESDGFPTVPHAAAV